MGVKEPNMNKEIAMWDTQWKLLVGKLDNTHMSPNTLPKKRKRAVNKLLWKHAKSTKPEAFRGGSNE